MAVREGVFPVPQIGISISDSELGIVLLSAVQKMGYDCATDDQKKAVKAFVVGKDCLTRDQLSRDQLPRDQLLRHQLFMTSTLM